MSQNGLAAQLCQLLQRLRKPIWPQTLHLSLSEKKAAKFLSLFGSFVFLMLLTFHAPLCLQTSEYLGHLEKRNTKSRKKTKVPSI